MIRTTLRTLVLLVATLTFSACELVGNIFQAGFVIGAIIVVMIVGIIAWIARRFRG